LVFNERGKPEYLKENLSVQNREPRDLTVSSQEGNWRHVSGRQVLLTIKQADEVDFAQTQG